MAMVLGLKGEDGRSLGDLSKEPYASMRQKTKYQPVADNLKAEMNRRAEANGLEKFKNKCCSKGKCQEWLKNNPVTNQLDVEFLVATEKSVHINIPSMAPATLSKLARLFLLNPTAICLCTSWSFGNSICNAGHSLTASTISHAP